MTEGPGAKDAPLPSTDEERARGQGVFGLGERERRAVLAWVGENLPAVRRSVYEERLLYWSLGIGFVVGLAAHVGGYVLRSSVTTEPLVLVADLLYALGYALWTGVVVVVFVQVFPEANGGSSSRRWMPTRQRYAMRPEPDATRRQGMTKRRRRGSGGSQRLELAGAAVARRVVSLLFYVVRGTAQTVAESRLAAMAGGISEQAWWSGRAAALRQVAPDFARRFPDSVWLAGAGTTRRRDDPAPFQEREAMEAFTTGLTVLLDGIQAAMARDRR